MNIYEFRVGPEKEWVCANTVCEALQCYNNANDIEIGDFDRTDDVVLVPETEWESHFIKDIDGNSQDVSFAEYMKTAKSPELFCTTCY